MLLFVATSFSSIRLSFREQGLCLIHLKFMVPQLGLGIGQRASVITRCLDVTFPEEKWGVCGGWGSGREDNLPKSASTPAIRPPTLISLICHLPEVL